MKELLKNKIVWIVFCGALGAVGLLWSGMLLAESRLSGMSRKQEIQMDICVRKLVYNQVIYDNIDMLDVRLIGSAGDSIPLSSIVDRERMVVYLPEVGCHACSDREVELVKSVFGREAEDYVWIIGHFDNLRGLRLFERQAGIKAYGLNATDCFPVNEMHLRPVVFLLSPQLRGTAFFQPDKELPQLSVFYYRAAYERFNRRTANARQFPDPGKRL